MSLECVSCKAQSVYEVSKSSYVYLEGTCQNCHNDSKLGVKPSATLLVAPLLVDFRENRGVPEVRVERLSPMASCLSFSLPEVVPAAS